MDNEGRRPVATGAGNAVDAEESDRVARFLRSNPDWLAQQHGLYECLSPPKRVHGEALADHMAAMIDAARTRSRTVLDAGRAGLGLSERVRTAVLSLIRAEEPTEWIGTDLARLLGLDAARLCAEGADLPAGTVERVMGPREVVLRSGGEPSEVLLLHGEASGLALHEAILRIRLAGRSPTVLALASREVGVLDGAGADGALGFLAAALSACLERA